MPDAQPAAPAAPAVAAPAVPEKPAPAAPAAPAAGVQPATPAVPEAKGYWPDDWQKRIAGDDEKELKQVGRYASPTDIWKKARSLEQRLSSGELKPVLPKDAKPEEVTAWRKDNGIPEKADGYDLKGVEVPETEKAAVTAMLKAAHDHNSTPQQAKAGVETYLAQQKAREQARAERDEAERVSALDSLNQEYGGMFRRNINLLQGTVLSKLPESVREGFKSARMPDGTLVFNNPDVIKGLVALALETNPAGVVVPGVGGDLAKSMTERYQEITKIMHEDRGRYNKDNAMQKEYRDLIDTMTKHDLIDKNGNLKGKKAA